MEIVEQIKKVADRDKLPEDHPLRIKAKNYLDTENNPHKTPEMLIAAWSEARKAYCEYTGEAYTEPSK